MTQQNTTIDLEEESKEGQEIYKDEAKALGIDHRKYDLKYLVDNSPFKNFSQFKIYDWSRYKIFSIMQMPDHPSYRKQNYCHNHLLETMFD